MSVRTHSPTPILKYGRGTLLRFIEYSINLPVLLQPRSLLMYDVLFSFIFLFYPLLYSTIFTSFYHIFISYPIHTSSIYNKRLRSPRLLSPLKLSYSYCITAFRLPSYIYTAFRHDSVLLPECLPSTF